VNPRLKRQAAVTGACFFAGALATLAFAPFHLHWFAPFPLVAVLFLSANAPGSRASAACGFAFGLGCFLGGVSWVHVSLNVYGAMPAPMAAIATLGFCGYLALFPALCFWLLYRIRTGAAWLAAFPALWVLTEWLRGWLLTGFGWQAIGYSQAADASPLAGYAPVGGVLAVSLAVAFTASRIEWTKPAGTPIDVALLQGNIPQDIKWQESKVVETLDTYWRLIRASGDAQLIVLPETALPLFSDRLPNEYLARLLDHARAHRGDILLGMVERSHDGREYYNSLFSIGTAPVQVYRKQHLVPFGEFVPPLFGWVIRWLHIPMQDFSSGGSDQRPMDLSGQKVAINICYEDAFGREVIRQLPEATILVNVSNTAWFGRSLAQPQHLQIARMRALEAGRPMLRATNTGMTAVIDPRGRVLAVADPFSEAVLRARVQGHEGVTPFVRVGDGLAVGLAMLLAVAAFGLARRAR